MDTNMQKNKWDPHLIPSTKINSRIYLNVIAKTISFWEKKNRATSNSGQLLTMKR